MPLKLPNNKSVCLQMKNESNTTVYGVIFEPIKMNAKEKTQKM